MIMFIHDLKNWTISSYDDDSEIRVNYYINGGYYDYIKTGYPIVRFRR